MKIYPKDDDKRQKGTKARALLPAMFDLSHWEYHEQTGTDHGTDMVFEYIEDEEFRGHKLEAQIKGRSKVEVGRYGIPLAVDVKTLNYGLSCKNAFVLFLVDLSTGEDAYYLPVQDYFIADLSLYDRLEKNTSTLTVYFSEDNKVSYDDFDLCQIAKSGYVMVGDRVKKVK
ncbi:MAG: DUF4365 domain-containing protein [Lachnospiraceae bacterium]|nr:DUF4365 domain-containing protein [Lachnospiraceae bacterium]